MHYRIHLAEKQLTKLLNHAERELPYESVALLFGKEDEQQIQVRTVNIVENTSSVPETEFSVEPEEEYRLLLDAEERNERLVGIFHSHSAPPYPSEKDFENMRLNQVAWLIASKSSGEWRTKAFLLIEDQPQEIPLEIT